MAIQPKTSINEIMADLINIIQLNMESQKSAIEYEKEIVLLKNELTKLRSELQMQSESNKFHFHYINNKYNSISKKWWFKLFNKM